MINVFLKNCIKTNSSRKKKKKKNFFKELGKKSGDCLTKTQDLVKF